MRLHRITQHLADPHRRAAARNFAWLLADRGVRVVLNVGVGFWVARHLGPTRFGALSYALATVAVMLPLAEMGVDALVRRDFVNHPEDAARTAGAAVVVRCIGALGAGLILLAGLPLGWAAGQERALVVVLSLTLLQPLAAVPELWLQAGLQARVVVPCQWFALTAGAAARIVFVLRDAPLVAFAWAAVLEAALGSLLVARCAWRRGLHVRWPASGRVRALARESWPLVLSGFATLIYMRLDVLMLRQMVGPAAAGVYAAATRLVEIWYFLPAALAASLLPSLLRARAAGRPAYERQLQWYYDMNVALAYAIALPTSLIAGWLIGLAYGPDYAEAARVLVVYVWALPFVFLGVARGQYLTNEGHTRFYLASTTAGLAVNIVLNWLLIPRYGATGAAWATLAAQAVAAWGSTFCFAPTRPNGWMQTRALLIAVRWPRHARPE